MATDPDRIGAALEAAGCVTPALVIDLAQVERNIAAMLRAVGEASRWRPHVKTIKQARLVGLLLEAGVRHFKCATVPELRMVLSAAAGHEVDVLLAYPVPVARLHELVELAASSPRARIGVTADDPDHLAAIVAAGRVDAWIDVDVGMHRTGSAPAVWQRWIESGSTAALAVAGIQAYEGHVAWDDPAAASPGYAAAAALADQLESCRWVLTSGSHAFGHALAADSLARAATRAWTHQIGPGTLVLGDVASTIPATAIGAAPSTFVAARVVARPAKGRITLDAGSKAIAPDRPPPSCAVLGHADWRPERASEEHLPVWIGDEPPPPRDHIVLLVPDHVCTTVNLHREVVYLRDGEVCGTGPIDAGGRERPFPAESR